MLSGEKSKNDFCRGCPERRISFDIIDLSTSCYYSFSRIEYESNAVSAFCAYNAKTKSRCVGRMLGDVHMKKMRHYDDPEMEVILFDAADIICESTIGDDEGGDEGEDRD